MAYARDISNNYYRGGFQGSDCEELLRTAMANGGQVRGGGAFIPWAPGPISAKDYIVQPNVEIVGEE